MVLDIELDILQYVQEKERLWTEDRQSIDRC